MFPPYFMLRPSLLRPRPPPRIPPLARVRPLSTMSDAHPRPPSDSDPDPRPDKKPRLGENPHPLQATPPSEPPMQLDAAGPSPSAPQKKQKTRKRKVNKHQLPEPYSSDDVVSRDALALLGSAAEEDALSAETEWSAPFEVKEEVELVVSCLSSTGVYITSVFRINSTRHLRVTSLRYIKPHVYRHEPHRVQRVVSHTRHTVRA